jgi:hypothetical protein
MLNWAAKPQLLASPGGAADPPGQIFESKQANDRISSEETDCYE